MTISQTIEQLRIRLRQPGRTEEVRQVTALEVIAEVLIDMKVELHKIQAKIK